MCSGEMKTRWRVFRADKNPTNRLPCWPLSNVSRVMCSCLTSLQSDLWPVSKYDGGWRAGAVGALGDMAPDLPFQGSASLPFLPSFGSRRENWQLVFLLAAPAGGAVGESSWSGAGCFLVSESTQSHLSSRKLWTPILRKNLRPVLPVEPVPWVTMRGSC